MGLLGAGFFLLFLSLSQAFWSSDAIDLVDQFQPGLDDLGFNDTYEVSVWGSVKSRLFSFVEVSKGELVLDAFEKALPYIYSFHNEDGNTSRALMFYIPGIFSDADTGQSLRAIHEFRSMGYDVVALPNPWSVDYITSNPRGTKPGDIIYEGYATLEMIKTILKNHPAKRVELTGASYGAFVASVVAAMDDPLEPILSRTTMIGPPMDFRYSLPFMDELLESEIDRAYELTFWQEVKIVWDYFFAIFQWQLSEESIRASKAFMAKIGFHNGIVNSIKAYDQTHRAGWVPRFIDRNTRLEWEKSLTFMQYFSRFAPELLDMLHSDFASIHYWIEQSLNQNKKVRVITAENDFLNPPLYPTKADLHRLPRNAFLSLPSGGHLGFLAFPWFVNFRETAW